MSEVSCVARVASCRRDACREFLVTALLNWKSNASLNSKRALSPQLGRGRLRNLVPSYRMTKLKRRIDVRSASCTPLIASNSSVQLRRDANGEGQRFRSIGHGVRERRGRTATGVQPSGGEWGNRRGCNRRGRLTPSREGRITHGGWLDRRFLRTVASWAHSEAFEASRGRVARGERHSWSNPGPSSNIA